MFSPTVTQALSLGVLAAAALVPLLWAVLEIRRSPFSPAQTVMAGINYLLTRLLWRTQVSGRLPLAAQQGGVIVCNHRASIDPTFIQLVAHRKVHWMVAKEYWESRLFGWFLRLCEVIPVRRGAVDMAATKLAIDYAQRGDLVGVFPEGRINVTPQLLLPGRPGAAWIALKARVPVIPCFVSGSPYDGSPCGSLFMPARVHLVIGPPIDLSAYYGREKDREVLQELTRRFLIEIAKLGGHPDFQPQLAGRFSPPANGAGSL
jgi:1-acyl-sn-glycerol-3-phosphate acyltransferase